MNHPGQGRGVITPEPHSTVFEEILKGKYDTKNDQELQLVNYHQGCVTCLKGVKNPLRYEDVKVPSLPIDNNDNT